LREEAHFESFVVRVSEAAKRGLTPEVSEIPGTRIRRITAAAEAAWDARMAELAQSEAVQLEAERRRAQAAEAGRIAAQSPLHVSRRQPRAVSRQQRARR
jgi:hypothetical protein